MIIKNSPDQAPKVEAAVDGRIMYSESRLESILLTLAPGETMPAHKNPFDVLFIGIEGKGSMVAEDRQLDISPGESIFVTADENRGWENTSDSLCRFMAVKILSRHT
jgi:quercetin dioxygenase-like cupin family protein